MGERVFYPALAGKPVRVLGDPDLPHTYTYVPDIGRGLVILGERAEAFGQAWHLPSVPTVSTRRFLELVGTEAGQTAHLQSTPKWLIQTLGVFSPTIRELVEMFYEFEEPFIVDHSKFEQAFGHHASPLAEAIRATVAWFCQNPPK